MTARIWWNATRHTSCYAIVYVQLTLSGRFSQQDNGGFIWCFTLHFSELSSSVKRAAGIICEKRADRGGALPPVQVAQYVEACRCVCLPLLFSLRSEELKAKLCDVKMRRSLRPQAVRRWAKLTLPKHISTDKRIMYNDTSIHMFCCHTFPATDVDLWTDLWSEICFFYSFDAHKGG